jgi:hypothetical protein
MTKEESLRVAIGERKFVRIQYDDNVSRKFVLEPYTLGYDESNQLALAGYCWATDPPTADQTGPRSYLVQPIAAVKLLEQKFEYPQNESFARDRKQFRKVVCSLYYPGKPVESLR